MSLSVVSHACTDAIAALAVPLPDAVPLHRILPDFDALLILIYNDATKLALHPSAIPVLRDLANHTPALAHCTRLLRNDIHGTTLVKLISTHVRDILRALDALVHAFLDNEDHLVPTATLHDLITNARHIPKDNHAAVCRAWKSDRESLDDNLQEIARMIDDAEADDPRTDPDDGWDEFGLADTAMDTHELARAKRVHRLLRLTTLFHKRIFLDLLAHPSTAPVSAYDALVVQSNLLLSTSDDLVAALYPPHDPAHVRTHILDLAKIITALQTHILPITDELLNTPKRVDKKWFDTCVDQILGLSSTSRAE